MNMRMRSAKFLLFAILSIANACLVPSRPHVPIFCSCLPTTGAARPARYAKLDGPGTINDVVRTPNFDRIASEGVLFRNAFVNAPSCTPCRSALLSGQYFWRTGRGAILQGGVWDDKIPSWPLLLHDERLPHRKKLEGLEPRHARRCAVWQAAIRLSESRRPHQSVFGERHEAGRRRQVGRTGEAGNSGRGSGQLQSVPGRRQQDEQPFCYWFGPTNVHRKWIKGSGKKLWGINPDDLRGKMPPFLPDVPEVREDLADYFGEIQAFDAALGVLLDELKESGQYDNTLIVVSGDHGPPGFPHGKCNLYDFGTRVALAIAGPGVRGGRVVDDLVSLPDLAPTLLEAGSVKPPDVMTARSLWPVLKSDREGLVDPARTAVFVGRERHVEMARANNLPYPQRGIRTASHLFIINFKPDRYPLGDPYDLDGDNPPSTQELTETTFVTLPDEDAGPTKAWLVNRRNDPKWKAYFDHAYGKRPREELFDLKKDPHQMRQRRDRSGLCVGRQ